MAVISSCWMLHVRYRKPSTLRDKSLAESVGNLNVKGQNLNLHIFLKARWNVKVKFSLVKLFFETVPAQIFSVTAWNMSEGKSEVFLWLRSISNGLGLERLAEEFESRGFRKTSSLKYIRSSDLDVLFPSPHKLLLAEKKNH